MSIKERIFHSILFEVIALIILISLSKAFTDHNPATVSGLAISLSLTAMLWNYVYNLGFDKIFGAERLSRGVVKRLGHGVGFEIGLLTVSMPMIMWVLDRDFISVFMINIGLSLFFVVYAVIYNWSYDTIRENFKPAAIEV
ncbi:PACE efflux transporter [Psychromonas ossibalaenae]|uniref:PACE efflux transporter n=1 Tax=Psychromonas ossibalaenae TaxID=444922 RepID=UPI000380BF55|nr:PACE efflux transporter [Psychromonas ossibalaenae]